MPPDPPSRISVLTTWIALAATVVLLMLGILWHGLSLEVQHRLWINIFERFGGPMSFRFMLQPTMAAIAALHDGLNDARGGHSSFFWTTWRDPTKQAGRLQQGLHSTARLMLLGFCIDVIYQFKVLDEFYPAEAVVIVILLAVIPYFIFRWIVEHIARRWFARTGSAR